MLNFQKFHKKIIFNFRFLFQSLIPMSTFMNPNESKTGKNPNQVRFFNKNDFDEKASNKQWDRVKIVCSQPFNKHVPFGLCFIKILGEKEPGSEVKKPLPLPMLKDEETIEIGSFFKRKKDSHEGTKQELSGNLKKKLWLDFFIPLIFFYFFFYFLFFFIFFNFFLFFLFCFILFCFILFILFYFILFFYFL